MSASASRGDRLRIAIQKSGRLSDPSLTLLAQCGLKFRQSRDKLFCFGETLPIDLLLVRDDDIPGLLADGVCDLGFVGRNVLVEDALGRKGERPIVELRALGFGGCRLSIAVPNEFAYEDVASLRGTRIATSYPNVLSRFLAEHGVDATPVVLNGSVEIAPRLGTADVICDLVSTGSTLQANQLREVAVVMQSEAVLAGTGREFADERGGLAELLLRRLDGALAVKDSKLVMLQARRDRVDAITRILPGISRPTLMPIEGSNDEVSLQALCVGAVTWQHLEDMKRAGASSLLVLPVEKVLS